MTTKPMKRRTLPLEIHKFQDLKLSELRDRVDELIAKFGPDADWELEADEGWPTATLYFYTPETDQEEALRLDLEERARSREAVKARGFSKLTKEELSAMGLRVPPGIKLADDLATPPPGRNEVSG